MSTPFSDDELAVIRLLPIDGHISRRLEETMIPRFMATIDALQANLDLDTIDPRTGRYPDWFAKP